jgi:cation transport regulator
MAKQLEDFPADVRENLTDGSQQIFLAAFNSASANGMSEEGALQVAWNSLKPGFEQGSDGKWHRRPMS